MFGFWIWSKQLVVRDSSILLHPYWQKKKGVLILARKNGRHGLELNHSNWIAAVIGDINRM